MDGPVALSMVSPAASAACAIRSRSGVLLGCVGFCQASEKARSIALAASRRMSPPTGTYVSVGMTMPQSSVTDTLHTNGDRYIAPGPILLALQAAEVRRRYRERTVIEEARHGLDRLASVPAQLRCGVSQDVDPGWGQASRPQVPPEMTVERPARDSLRACSGLPERFAG